MKIQENFKSIVSCHQINDQIFISSLRNGPQNQISHIQELFIALKNLFI